jgi:hypothetical protein
MEAIIPAEILQRLSQNQQDNQARTEDMFQEFVKINIEFQDANVRYLNLKGLTLVPSFCSDPAFRVQLDLDLLVDGQDAARCSEILMKLGYFLVAKSGTTWEFKTNEHVIPLMRDMYKAKPQRSVELHLVPDSNSPASATPGYLSRMQYQTWRGFSFPALSECDKFLAQAEHLFKHCLSEWTRPSWLWEYRTFVSKARDDETFWGDVKELAEQTGYNTNAIRASSHLASQLFGACTVPALDIWTLGSSPQLIDLWIDRYGKEILLTNFPGSKLYLLLPEDSSNCERSLSPRRLKKLFPVRRPLPIIATSRKRILSRAGWNYRFTELRYCVFRFRFHVAAGMRYLLEVPRWRRVVSEFQA